MISNGQKWLEWVVLLIYSHSFLLLVLFPIYHNHLFIISLMFTYLFIFNCANVVIKSTDNIGWVNQAVVVQA